MRLGLRLRRFPPPPPQQPVCRGSGRSPQRTRLGLHRAPQARAALPPATNILGHA
jgi:hypothetical protein